jgi:hypothetical protein
MAVILRTTMQGNAKIIAPAYSDIVIYAEGISPLILAQQVAGTISNVKYICKVTINAETVATLKAPVDSNDKAIFRISSILQDYTETDKSGYDLNAINSSFNNNSMLDSNHSIHQIDEYARNRNNLKHCTCLGGFEYINSSGTTIQQLSISTNVDFLFFNSVLQHNAGYSTQDFSDYILNNASTSKFLSKLADVYDVANGQKIQLGQYHTLAFLNGKISKDASYHSEVTRIQINPFDSDNNITSINYVDNTSLNGGAPFGSIISATLNGGDNTNEGLLYFGCGTAQLAQLGIDLTNVVGYYVRAYNGTSAVSPNYRFDIQDADCKGFETIRLAFLNSLGAWDYYNFTKKSIRKTQINKTAIKQNYGTTPYLSSRPIGDFFNFDYYTQGTYDGGTRVFNVNAIETIEANTDFIREDEAAILEELFLSPDVYMQTGTTFEPVVINETEYIKQTTANDMLKQYIITIEKGHNTRVQRL